MSCGLRIASGAAVEGTDTRHNAWSPALSTLHQRLKAQFDPAGIFNRGRLYPDL
jgi:glycolate oxidase FAD binding subunit